MGVVGMKNGSVKQSLAIMSLMLVLISVIVVGTVAIIGIRVMSNTANSNYENAKLEGYNTQIRLEVQSVITILQSEYEKAQSGVISQEEAQHEAAEIVRSIRYGDDSSGYFWIDDTDYNLVMHPILPEQEGNNRYTLEDQNGIMIIQNIYSVCTSAEKGGYNEFYFTKSDGVTVAPKIAYSQIFEPWGWMISTGNYTDDMVADMETVKNAIKKSEANMQIIMVIFALVIAVAAVMVSIVFGNILCRPLIKIQKLADRMATGDLSTNIDVHENNEYGKTGKALNEAQKQIIGLISNIKNTSMELSEAATEFTDNFSKMDESMQNVSIAVNEIAENTTAQAEATTSASENIENMADGISDASKEILSLEENADIMTDRSLKSMEIFKQLIDINRKTKVDIDSMYDQTESNNESVRKISDAALLIGEIAEQTNLLSLNASIEAARAGEAGKGFAVVAEEIGKLAQQSDDTVNQISEIIAELTNNSEKSVNIMHAMNEASEIQVNVLGQTQQMFTELKEALDACTTSINVIGNKMDHVNSQRNAIMDSISTLNRLAVDNASSTQETSAMASEISNAVMQSSQVVRELDKDIKVLSDNIQIFKF